MEFSPHADALLSLRDKLTDTEHVVCFHCYRIILHVVLFSEKLRILKFMEQTILFYMQQHYSARDFEYDHNCRQIHVLERQKTYCITVIFSTESLDRKMRACFL